VALSVLSIEQVLAEEANAIRGETPAQALLTESVRGQDAQAERIEKNADRRDGTDLPHDEVERRKSFYRSLNKMRHAALCCSGGGIRSATFCLGVIQALADCDVSSASKVATYGTTAGNVTAATSNAFRKISDDASPKPENSLLGRFHYLSTVSGGGYVGSWLSSWRSRDDFATVVRNLIGRPSGGDVEPPEISWLRAYTNYLTPRVGVASADAWSAVAIIVRNLILNWLIILPVVCIVLLALKIIASASVWVAEAGDKWAVIAIAAVGVACLIVAQSFTTGYRPSRRAPGSNASEPLFLVRNFIWAFIAAIAGTILLSSYYFALHMNKGWTGLTSLRAFAKLHDVGTAKVVAAAAVAGLLIYAAGWIAGLPSKRDWRDFTQWAASGLIYGALVGLGAYLYHLLQSSQAAMPLDRRYTSLLVPIIFGVPWMLMSQLAAESVFVGLASYDVDADADREWLGRTAGWLATGAIIWALTAFLVFAGDYAVHYAVISMRGLVPAGGLAGIVTALLGKSSLTPARQGEKGQGFTGEICNIALKIAGPLFVAALLIVLSVALDRLLLADSLVVLLRSKEPPQIGEILPWLALGFGIALAVSVLASYWVNVNRFSLHSVYRNRLIRGYLGASRQERTPDQFTGFDSKDNIRLDKLWPPKAGSAAISRSLFHIVNITLNVVSTKRLAWQERKAEPFTVSPLHCGSAYLGYRLSKDYGDRPGRGGISLGTAMAISGAAVSSNMGYYSSPSLTLLLSLFNVRLGWWLGNPGKAGDRTYQTDGPTFAAIPLLAETFGLTTDQRPYVYLSDGGHFEDLGLYEMVRRRCRFIVVIDAGADAKYAFEDLGNAVRKIYIDLGIPIEFQGLEQLRNRPTHKVVRREAGGVGELPSVTIPYYAIGKIDYACADGDEPGCEKGLILYIKPAYHGTEGAGIISYATAHSAFPHETTVDQWFTESQFESYRSLGREITSDVLCHSGDIVVCPQARKTLRDVLAELENPMRA
jgi:hypothetical protein